MWKKMTDEQIRLCVKIEVADDAEKLSDDDFDRTLDDRSVYFVNGDENGNVYGVIYASSDGKMHAIASVCERLFRVIGG